LEDPLLFEGERSNGLGERRELFASQYQLFGCQRLVAARMRYGFFKGDGRWLNWATIAIDELVVGNSPQPGELLFGGEPGEIIVLKGSQADLEREVLGILP